mmetsp:Transcript_52005/g.156076  ORF Transcript_52005/g.156076 Transcript_52005/m.156076 type:complete len:285 (-) Transcript_52005:379-1233(-)
MIVHRTSRRLPSLLSILVLLPYDPSRSLAQYAQIVLLSAVVLQGIGIGHVGAENRSVLPQTSHDESQIVRKVDRTSERAVAEGNVDGAVLHFNPGIDGVFESGAEGDDTRVIPAEYAGGGRGVEGCGGGEEWRLGGGKFGLVGAGALIVFHTVVFVVMIIIDGEVGVVVEAVVVTVGRCFRILFLLGIGGTCIAVAIIFGIAGRNIPHGIVPVLVLSALLGLVLNERILLLARFFLGIGGGLTVLLLSLQSALVVVEHQILVVRVVLGGGVLPSLLAEAVRLRL